MATLKSDLNSPLSGHGIRDRRVARVDEHGYATVKLGFIRIALLALVGVAAVIGVVKVLMG
jgi:hypothetical protein